MDSILRAKLKRLVEHQDWEAIYSLTALITDKWHNEEVKAPDEFNTIWNQAKKEGKIEGLKEFMESAEKLALND